MSRIKMKMQEKKLFPKIIVSWRVGGYFLALFISSIFSIPIFFLKESIILIPLIFVAVFFLTELMINLSYKNWKYEFRESELRLEKGVIVKIYKTIPYSRIQNIDIRRGIFARILGYSTIMIHTAGYSGVQGQSYFPEGYIPGVSIKEAENIRELIIKKIGKKKN